MELVLHRIPIKQGDHRPIYIAPIGDIQWSGKNGPTAKDSLRRHLDRCLELNAWYVGLGDYTDAFSPSNRTRLASANLYDTAADTIDEKMVELVHELYDEFLKPTKGRWLALLEGHHWAQLKSGETTDQRLAELLGARFAGTSAYINIQFCILTSKLPVVLWVHHGCGGGLTPGAPLNRLDKLASRFEGADVFMMGHTCLTTRARIMTRRGFKSHDEARIGEDVLAYDMSSGICRWTPLRDVTVYPDAPLLRASSKSFRAEMTPDHQWVMRNHRGIEQLRTLEDAKSYERIVVARAAEGGVLASSPRDAAILGWLVTDGCITRPQGRLDCRVIQKKPQYVSELRVLLGGDASEYLRKQGQTEFYLHAPFARRLLASLGFSSKADLPRIVSRLSPLARAAMLDAFLKAEGDGVRTFNQQPGSVWDAFLMLAALQGIRLGVRRRAYDPERPMFIAGRRIRPHGPVWRARILSSHQGAPTVAYIRSEPLESDSVWCPTTDYGTWVAELDGQTFITGNTKSPADRIPKPFPLWNAKPRPKLVHRDALLVNTGGFSKSYVEHARQGKTPRGHYAEQRMLPPSSIGAPILEIRPYIKDKSIEHKGKRLWRHRTWMPEIRVIL